MNKLLLIILLISLCFLPRQKRTDGEKQISPTRYILPHSERSYGIEKGSLSNIFVDRFTHAYWILISDVDGDNCPFSPSCSSFFVESVKETNIFQGTLMFADRLTRDTNFLTVSIIIHLQKTAAFMMSHQTINLMQQK